MKAYQSEFPMSRWKLYVGRLLKLCIFMLILVMISRLAPSFKRIRPERDARNNAEMLAVALCNFHKKFGKFPDEESSIAVEHITGRTNWILKGEFSNDFYRQLLATHDAKSEYIFYVKTDITPNYPDNVLL